MAVSAVGYPQLTAEQVQSILVQPLVQQSVFLAAGPRIFDTNGSQVRIPKLVSSEEVSWHGENEKITESDLDLDSIVLMPPTMKSLKVIVPLSNEIIRQSVVPLESSVRDRLVYDVAAKIDRAFLGGLGDPGTEVPGTTIPQGMTQWSGVSDLPVDGAVTLDDMHDAVGTALGSYATPSRWFITPKVFTYIRKLKDSYGRYQLEPDPSVSNGYQLLGIPVSVTAFLPAGGTVEAPTSEIVLADMNQVAVARDLEPSVRILDQTRGDYDQTLIRVVTRYDAKALNPEGIVILSGVAG